VRALALLNQKEAVEIYLLRKSFQLFSFGQDLGRRYTTSEAPCCCPAISSRTVREIWNRHRGLENVITDEVNFKRRELLRDK
jgi:hypothetical protein